MLRRANFVASQPLAAFRLEDACELCCQATKLLRVEPLKSMILVDYLFPLTVSSSFLPSLPATSFICDTINR